MAMRSALEELRKHFEDTDRTAGEVVVSWIRVAMGISMVSVLAAGHSMRWYPGPAWTVLLAALPYSWVALVWVAREARRGRVSNATAYTLTALDSGIILTLTALTGLWTSPMLPILVLVVFTFGVRYSLPQTVAVAVVTSAALVAVVLWVPRPDFGHAERVRMAAWWSWMLLSGGILAGVLSHAAELAHRKRAQAVAAADAEHRRLDEERALRQRLEAIDEARKDFLHALAHDFRTPIASLEALAQALGWEQHPLSDPEKAEVIALIQSHAGQLGAMLGEVREVAITESLGAPSRVEVSDVYMPELIRSATSAAGLAPDRVSTSIDPGLKVLKTDSRKIFRILTNLLENAHKHSPAAERIEVRLALRRGMVELAVLDRGPGIPPELTSEALQKWVSFGQHRSSGLGMWIVSQFIAALDGEIGVDPRPGGGLIVRARFPAKIATARPAATVVDVSDGVRPAVV
ncbi:MAG TPA: HAMP domain-containing sensor histidine kinase [Acidimicrobiia bacterium]